MVYLLHFDKPLHHARHYVGYCDNLENRLERHAKGNGSKLMAAVSKAGIGFKLVRVWLDADRNRERWLHNKKNSPQLCPICRKQR